MNEAETRAELIDPALRAAGWGVVAGSRVRREVIAPGRIEGSAPGGRGRGDIADYVLIYRNHKLAVIEAKSRSKHETEGLGQAKRYAEKLQARFAYSTNGDRLYQADMQSGDEGPVDCYPAPNELWDRVFAEANQWRDRFAAVPFEGRGGAWEPRYYQHNAINRVLESVAAGQQRILLTMATGTGKTAVAFQIAWKLFHSRWNLTDWRSGREPSRRPRILFLADRNILADQAFNSFSAFPEDALVRIDPESIRKKGRVPKNGSIFFTIFQTFMTTGSGGVDDEDNPVAGEANFGDYPPDFFDFIIIDECHRGGANDESTWRAILEYFSPAVQLGLTATPKRDNNVDTYAYFGEPVYVYSLKEGINDGFLTPFRVKQVSTTLDNYTYTSDDLVLAGEVAVGEVFREQQFNRTIQIHERERYRVERFMEMIDRRDKTLVFCATQKHALAVRDLINQLATGAPPNYCARVTADDGAIGEQHLRTFQDNEKTIPTILTTSQKLSTGVDARNVRNIVLMRPINSIIEFKQIIGRGTRLYEGKAYFTIYDFVRAYEHFNDPEWDGEPVEPEPPRDRPRGEGNGGGEPPPPPPPREKIVIKLADGKERTIQSMVATTFWSPEGRPMSAAEFVQGLFGEIPALFEDEAALRRLWSQPDTRRKLLEELAERGYGAEQLEQIAGLINAEKSDIYDVLAYVAYASPPMAREERVATHRHLVLGDYDPKQQEFIEFVLAQYIEQGVGELDQDKLPDLLELKYHAVSDAVAQLGQVAAIRELFIGFQKHLYEPSTAA